MTRCIRSTLLLLRRLGKMRLSRLALNVVNMNGINDGVTRMKRRLNVHILGGSLPQRSGRKRESFDSLRTLTTRYSVLAFRMPLCGRKPCGAFRLTSRAFFQSLGHYPIVVGASHKRIVRAGTLLGTLRSKLVSSTVVSM